MANKKESKVIQQTATEEIICDCPKLGRLCDPCYIEILKLCYRKHFTLEEALEIRNDPKRCVY